MKAGLRGRVHTPEGASIVEARLGSGLSQASFAALMGVSVRTLHDWEQGRRDPSGAAKSRLPSPLPAMLLAPVMSNSDRSHSSVPDQAGRHGVFQRSERDRGLCQRLKRE